MAETGKDIAASLSGARVRVGKTMNGAVWHVGTLTIYWRKL